MDATGMVDELWRPQIDGELCTGCSDCVVVCPTDALALAGEVAVLVAPAACTYGGRCEAVCPASAIALPYQVVLADQAGGRSRPTFV